MTAPFQGGCRCGAIRYEVTAEPVVTVECHCRDCQYSSGTGHSIAVLVPASAFRLLQGATNIHTTTAESGKAVHRHFCPDCGSPLFGDSGGPLWSIKAASLDDPSWLTIAAAVFTRSAQPWSHLDPNLPAFEAMPPMAPPKE